MTRIAWVCAASLALAPPVARGADTPCATVDGAPAATSGALVLGMRERMAAGDRAGLQKFLDTGQTLLLVGGNAVEVLQRRPEEGLVLVRRPGPGQLPFWTLTGGIACDTPDLPAKER